MAILKTVNTPFGVQASYNKIVKAEINANTQTVELMVAIYASSQAREADAPPMWHEYVRIPFSKFTQDPRDLLYPMLAAYGDSYLKDGMPDQEGFSSPGNFEINLKPEALFPTVEVPPEPEPAPVIASISDFVLPPAPVVETPGEPE